MKKKKIFDRFEKIHIFVFSFFLKVNQLLIFRFASLIKDVKWDFWQIWKKIKFFSFSFSSKLNKLLIFRYASLINDVKWDFWQIWKIKFFVFTFSSKLNQILIFRFASMVNGMKLCFWQIWRKKIIFFSFSYFPKLNQLLIFRFAKHHWSNWQNEKSVADLVLENMKKKKKMIFFLQICQKHNFIPFTILAKRKIKIWFSFEENVKTKNLIFQICQKSHLTSLIKLAKRKISSLFNFEENEKEKIFDRFEKIHIFVFSFFLKVNQLLIFRFASLIKDVKWDFWQIWKKIKFFLFHFLQN